MHHPPFLYGTAWKEDRTRGLVEQALRAGFRGIDTANQRKHYFEAGVGEAIAGWPRDELWLQTKFTHVGGQDQRLPYDPTAPIGRQVHESFASSLEHLGVEHLDSYVLHGPTRRVGLGPDDHGAWRAMEEIHAAGGTRHLGVSNVTLEQLEALWSFARVKPSYVQNRCYARTGWDAEVRAFCRDHGVVYQGFSLLTANRHVLAHPAVYAMAEARGVRPAQIVFAFALAVGMLPLTGTTDPAHMRADLAVVDLALEPDEVRLIEARG